MISRKSTDSKSPPKADYCGKSFTLLVNKSDLLWADPVDNDDGASEQTFKNNDVRGCSYYFGYDAVSKFLKNNSLLMVIRAHEAQIDGLFHSFLVLAIRCTNGKAKTNFLQLSLFFLHRITAMSTITKAQSLNSNKTLSTSSNSTTANTLIFCLILWIYSLGPFLLLQKKVIIYIPYTIYIYIYIYRYTYIYNIYIYIYNIYIYISIYIYI